MVFLHWRPPHGGQEDGWFRVSQGTTDAGPRDAGNHGNTYAGEVMQYLKSRFTVMGEASKTAQENYQKGYEKIDWSERGKTNKTKEEGKNRPDSSAGALGH